MKTAMQSYSVLTGDELTQMRLRAGLIESCIYFVINRKRSRK